MDGDPLKGDTSKMLWLIRGLSILALGLSCFLIYRSLAAGAGGCGAGFDCQSVLSSRWSHWFGIPVAVPGALVYLGIFLTSFFLGGISPVRRAARAVFTGLCFAALAGAIWMTIVQWRLLHRMCPYCMAVHACGVLIACLATVLITRRLRLDPGARRGSAVVASVLMVLLVIGQWQGERASVFDLTRRDVALDLNFPLLGKPDAPYRMAAMTDYTCPHCRAAHAFLMEAVRRYGGRLVVIEVPVPLNKDCNPTMASTPAEHVFACDLARLALAVWRADPDKFEAIEDYLTGADEPRRPEDAWAFGGALVGEEKLNRARHDPWIEQSLQRGAELFRDAGGGNLPKLIFPHSVLSGPIRTADELFTNIEKELPIRRAE